MDIETFWYEAQPHAYTFAGWAALRNTDSPLSILAGVALLGLAALLLRERWKFRTQRSSIVKRTAWRRSRARRKLRLGNKAVNG